MLDPITCIRPLIRIIEAQVHMVGFDAPSVYKSSRDGSLTYLRVITKKHFVVGGFVAGQLSVCEWAIRAMQMGMSEIAYVVDDY